MGIKHRRDINKSDMDASLLIRYLNGSEGPTSERIVRAIKDSQMLERAPRSTTALRDPRVVAEAHDGQRDSVNIELCAHEPLRTLNRLSTYLQAFRFEPFLSPLRDGRLRTKLRFDFVPVGYPLEARLAIQAGIKGQDAEKEPWLVLSIIHLSRGGVLLQLQECRCKKWYWRSRKNQKHCSPRCRVKQYLADPDVKERRKIKQRQYQRDYYRKNFKAIRRAKK